MLIRPSVSPPSSRSYLTTETRLKTRRYLASPDWPSPTKQRSCVHVGCPGTWSSHSRWSVEWNPTRQQGIGASLSDKSTATFTGATRGQYYSWEQPVVPRSAVPDLLACFGALYAAAAGSGAELSFAVTQGLAHCCPQRFPRVFGRGEGRFDRVLGLETCCRDLSRSFGLGDRLRFAVPSRSGE
ncbi:uncharacterized protein B0I36DRAFT_47526 [Microdochium trichocladiopsis]|uniref:Uncharacterized protein n=1 Tax=Microdochium trichocladiopsis TaxID=1682393 RepID=A0A9P8XU27_9PEZI|nr:uncharacterized protein B0I36DRAFT_47526 [Microdochium trichocladiopsis]KAH7016548.1 hypothetical protein B0I36DRAFT_47526 [Microdochium trichocladiopsis]